MNKKIILSILIVAMVLVTVFIIRNIPEGTEAQTINVNTEVLPKNDEVIDLDDEQPKTEPEDPSSGISEQELAINNLKDDCWIVYDNKVYDITSFIPRHKGGEDKIARNCGSANNFQREFTNQHGTSKVNLLMNVGTFIGDFDVIGELNN